MKKVIIILSLIFVIFSNIFSFSFKKNISADVTPILIKYYKKINNPNVKKLKKRYVILYNQIKNSYSSEYFMNETLPKYEKKYEKILKNNINKEYVVTDTFTGSEKSQKYRVNRNSKMYKMYLFHAVIGNQKGEKIKKRDVFGNHIIKIKDINNKKFKNKIFKDEQLIRKIAYFKMIEDLKKKTEIKYYYDNIDNYDKIGSNGKLAKASDKILKKKDLTGFLRALGHESNRGRYKLRNLFIINQNIENIILSLKKMNKSDLRNINERFESKYVLEKIKDEVEKIKLDNIDEKNIREKYEKSPKTTRTQFLYIKFDKRTAAEEYNKKIKNSDDYDRIAKKLLNRVEFTSYLEKNTHKSYKKFEKYVGLEDDTVLPIMKFSDKYILPKINKTKTENILSYQNFKNNYLKELKKEKYVRNILKKNKTGEILTKKEIDKLKNYLK